MNLPVEVIANGVRQRAISQDLSPLGIFIRLVPQLAVGTLVQLVLSPNGQRLITTGFVTHALSEVEAVALGRSPGIGVVFREPVRSSDQQFAEAVARLLHKTTRTAPVVDLHIVVADPSTRLLERLSTALGGAGFSVATATNGMEAISACLSRAPDVVLVERDMPVVDGQHVLQEMGRHAQLASVPVMMMSADASEVTRLHAFQLGAMDFIPKPFTVLEVILRARRWARASQRDTERIVLRGTLSELGMPALMSMLEQERKTGQLSVIRDQVVVWIDFVEGRIVRARSAASDADSRTVLMDVLDWADGFFELSAGTPGGTADLDATVTHLLLDHAHRRDELVRTAH